MTANLNGNAFPLGSASWCGYVALNTWNLGKVLSQRGVNYQIEAKDKETLVVHHNQLKACAIPQDGGKPVCPVPETGEIEVIYGPLLGERNHVVQIKW